MKSTQEVLKNLKELYGENSMTARYEISKEFFCARMQKGVDIGAHSNITNKRKDKEVVLVVVVSSNKTGKKKKSKKGFIPPSSARVSMNKGKNKELASSRVFGRNDVCLKIDSGASIMAKAVEST
ncbi:hypothetical protein CRG98_011768 [Punica granatum]|uniref:Uncharacterized protein n=1 Tax=Punica granatum TaxID=22663 RepID=A0A2I0KHD4_PUNGR|nr:hypothetical protein CRG98_011768 [Punica granatum]